MRLAILTRTLLDEDEPLLTPRRTWTPHLWVFVPPIAAVLIGYTLWTLWMILLSMKLPPWLFRAFYF